MQLRFALGAVLDKGYRHPVLHRSNDTGQISGNREEGIRNKFGGQAADTGHWRGSNESQKATVRIATGGTPAWEIGCGHCPQRLPCQRELAKIFDF